MTVLVASNSTIFGSVPETFQPFFGSIEPPPFEAIALTPSLLDGRSIEPSLANCSRQNRRRRFLLAQQLFFHFPVIFQPTADQVPLVITLDAIAVTLLIFSNQRRPWPYHHCHFPSTSITGQVRPVYLPSHVRST